MLAFLFKSEYDFVLHAISFINRWSGTSLRAVAVTCYLPLLDTESSRGFPLRLVPITMASTEIPRQAVSGVFYSGCRRQKTKITLEHAWYHQQCNNYIYLVPRVRDWIGPPSHFTVDVSSEDSMKCGWTHELWLIISYTNMHYWFFCNFNIRGRTRVKLSVAHRQIFAISVLSLASSNKILLYIMSQTSNDYSVKKISVVKNCMSRRSVGGPFISNAHITAQILC